ncbi:uncharacterized protein LOC129229319 [Uloborus diversus]|uniref:uncharacterized protein LOC129229319 n=1 Tax=Uloborus diversus TaxID=327109 RepID=UPI0024096526|nr:uncharacterized protein LOC129229319 [Uloborus diversus]
MGNGSSQSIVLGPPRLQATCPVRNGYHYQRGGVPKYVHPQNRVLPKPVAGQRLRSTDNGSILQTAGTIRGQRRDSLGREEEGGDPEVMGILRKRSEIIEKENDCYRQFNLRNHRMFHSDPDIARRPDSSGYQEDGFNNRRQSGAAARASKLKCKKKARAPEPPGDSLLRDRRQQQSEEERMNQKNCRCINKSKAPQPPAIVVHPPPPPPLPNSVTTRTKINCNDRLQKGEVSSRSPSVTRSVECHENRTSYEKNVHPLEKWRNYRSTGDVRIDEQDEPLHGSRTTVFDSKKLSDSQTKLPSHLPHRPDPFQKEIQAVTKKIAETRKDNLPAATDKVSPAKNAAPPVKQNTNSPPKFYFADTGVFKMGNANSKTDSSAITNKPLTKYTLSENKQTVESSQRKNTDSRDLPQQCTTIDEIVPSLQRFSPARRRYKSPTRNSGLSSQQNAEKEWEDLSRNLCNKTEDSDIDIRLRPVLPRKPPEMPKFSPSEAWQALGSDGLGSSNQSTSDDGPDLHYKNEVSPQYNSEDGRPRRFSDMAFNRYDRGNVFKHRSLSDSHWTPIQDLMDDSDVSSDESEDAVVPRIRPGSNEIPTRFSLPTVMFSNMRPIGCEMKANLSAAPYLNENPKVKQSKKAATKYNEPSDQGLAPHFRKFLSKRNKYLSEEDIAVSDSNWTFGQYGLQKRGKQYSSELMLSDKKKSELMRKSNFSDFLGDILVSKANLMRTQMKSSDSGNSNFSFYSTEGQIMFVPEKGSFAKEAECSPPTKGRVYDIRRKFDPNIEPKKPNYWGKTGKKPNPSDLALGRKRDLELAKMLEDEVRKRRNKEKINIRQQLQKMKSLHSEDEEDDFDDEAYFTEPKSREESQSPFFTSGIQRHFLGSDIGFQPSHHFGGAASGSRLSHWQSSPALLEDTIAQNGNRPVFKGRQSSSSLMSSPDPETWTQTSAVVEPWLQRQRILENKVEESRLGITTTDTANDGDVSSSPTPALQKKERRKTNIYKQLMDIVRKEEKHLKKAEQADPNSPESSQLESSPSSCSESSSTSSYSYSDSSGSRNHGKNGIPANKEFHTSGYANSTAASSGAMPSFQVAFVQPYHPSKSYRPVPFDVVTSNGYRMRDLQEERKHLQAEAS